MFDKKLKTRREEIGLSQEGVAAFFGENFSRQAVYKWECGNGYPEVEKLLICWQLNLTSHLICFLKMN